MHVIESGVVDFTGILVRYAIDAETISKWVC
jgi:hypothetical protein